MLDGGIVFSGKFRTINSVKSRQKRHTWYTSSFESKKPVEAVTPKQGTWYTWSLKSQKQVIMR